MRRRRESGASGIRAWETGRAKDRRQCRVFHRRPVARRARGQHAGRTGRRQQLLEGLHAVKDTRTGSADNRGFVLFDDENVALRFHHRIEGQMIARQDSLRCRGVRTQERDAIRRLRGRMRILGGGRDALDRVLQIARGELVFCIAAGNGDQNSGRQIGGLPKIGLARRGQKLHLRLRGAECRRRDEAEKHYDVAEGSRGGGFATCQLRPP
jgi:hypothetical protein